MMLIYYDYFFVKRSRIYDDCDYLNRYSFDGVDVFLEDSKN